MHKNRCEEWQACIYTEEYTGWKNQMAIYEVIHPTEQQSFGLKLIQPNTYIFIMWASLSDATTSTAAGSLLKQSILRQPLVNSLIPGPGRILVAKQITGIRLGVIHILSGFEDSRHFQHLLRVPKCSNIFGSLKHRI